MGSSANVELGWGKAAGGGPQVYPAGARCKQVEVAGYANSRTQAQL